MPRTPAAGSPPSVSGGRGLPPEQRQHWRRAHRGALLAARIRGSPDQAWPVSRCRALPAGPDAEPVRHLRVPVARRAGRGAAGRVHAQPGAARAVGDRVERGRLPGRHVARRELPARVRRAARGLGPRRRAGSESHGGLRLRVQGPTMSRARSTCRRGLGLPGSWAGAARASARAARRSCAAGSASSGARRRPHCTAPPWRHPAGRMRRRGWCASAPPCRLRTGRPTCRMPGRFPASAWIRRRRSRSRRIPM